MKQTIFNTALLLSTCILCIHDLSAQSSGTVYTNVDMPDPASYAAEPFLKLNASRLSTGFLMDAGLGFVNLPMYDGAATQHDSLTVDGGTFEDIYITAASTAMTSTAAQILSNPKHTTYAPVARSTVHLVGLMLKYDRIDPTAFNTGRLQIDEASGEVRETGSAASPYQQAYIYAAAPGEYEIGPAVTGFIFERAALRTNIPVPGSFQVEVNGVWTSFNFDQLYNIADLGNSLTVKTRLITGSGTFYSRTRLSRNTGDIVARVQTGCISPCDQSLPFTYQGVEVGNICISYNSGSCAYPSSNSPLLDKPLVIVNGFDPGNEGDRRFTRLREGLTVKGSNYYQDVSPSSKLLSSEGYDLLFVTFYDGKASNKTTALWLQSAIVKINDIKAQNGIGGQLMPLIGVSMGGLVSKIALSNMEALNQDHQVDKFFTFDSPLQGAYIPLGLQHTLMHLYRMKIWGMSLSAFTKPWISPLGSIVARGAVADINDQGRQLDNDAAREMLFQTVEAEVNYLPGVPTFRRLEKLKHTTRTDYHLAFQTYLNGKTIRIPHYAISDGDITRGLTVVEPGQSSPISANAKLYQVGFAILRKWNNGAGYGMELTAKCLPETFTMVRPKVSMLGVINFITYKQNHYDITPNYDLLPGATLLNKNPSKAGDSNCDGEEDEARIAELKKGLRRRFTRYHAFIPTTSSQNLPVGTNLSASMGPGVYQRIIPTAELLVNTQKDPVKVYNHEHTIVTPSVSNFLLDALGSLGSEFEPVGGVAKVVAEHFNYGTGIRNNVTVSTKKTISGRYLVQSNGRIAINTIGRIANMSEPNHPQSLPQPFAVNLARTSCNPSTATIDVQPGGRLDVGDTDRAATFSLFQNTAVTLSGGAMTIAAGSMVVVGDLATLTVRAGSTLTVNGSLMVQGSGRIIVENQGALNIAGAGVVQVVAGGLLLVNGGATFRLDDAANARGRAALRLGLSGRLQVDGAFTHGGNGRVELLDGAIVQANSPFKLTGEGVTRTSVLVVGAPEVRGPGGLDFAGLEAYYNGQATLRVTDPQASVRLHNVKLLGNPSAGQASGIKATSLRTVTVTSSVFELMHEGLLIWGPVVPNSTSTYTISASQFRACRKGLLINSGGTISVANTTFDKGALTGGATAVDVLDAQSVTLNYVTAKNFRFPSYGVTPNNAAVRIIGNTTVTVRGGSYENNSYAFNFTDAPSVAFSSCTRITGNEYGIYAYGSATRGVVRLSGTLIAFNNTAISGTDVSLSGSGNDLEHNPNHGGKFLRLWYDQRPLPTASTPLNLAGNFWSAAAGARATWYDLKTLSGQTAPNNVTTSSARSSNACGGFGPGQTIPLEPELKVKAGFSESTAAHDVVSPDAPDADEAAELPGSSGVAVDEWATPTLILYPNPSAGTATARFDHFEPIIVEVFDAAGRKVYRLTGAPGQAWQIEDPLSAGLFRVIALDAGGRQLQQSLVVQ